MLSFGQKLKHERESRNTPLEDISRTTQIGIRYLEALERNEFESLPGPLAFGKLYVRAYARILGFDPQPLIDEYDEERYRRIREARAAGTEAPFEQERVEDSPTSLLPSNVRSKRTTSATEPTVVEEEPDLSEGVSCIDEGRPVESPEADVAEPGPLAGASDEAVTPADATEPTEIQADAEIEADNASGIPPSDSPAPELSAESPTVETTIEPRSPEPPIAPPGPELFTEPPVAGPAPAVTKATHVRSAGSFAEVVVRRVVRIDYRVRWAFGAALAILGVSLLWLSGALSGGVEKEPVAVESQIPNVVAEVAPTTRPVETRPAETPPEEAKSAPEPALGGDSHLRVTASGVGLGVRNKRLVGVGEEFEEGQVVYFATRVMGGRSGETVRHVWLRDGGWVQTVDLKLGGAHWRTHSRKTLWGTGRWSVEARDAEGNVLARATFACVPRGG